MASIKRNKQDSIVSNSDGGGAVVRGSRYVRGRVIGEVLAGGRNISCVTVKERQAPRPGKDSARHYLRPVPKPVTMGDDYADFGFKDEEDGWENLREAAPSHSGALARQRQDEFNIFTYIAQAFGVAIGGLGLFVVIAAAYWLFAEDLSHKFPFLRLVLVPLLLAVWCGAKVGANASRRMRME